jgi:hypothetical protein
MEIICITILIHLFDSPLVYAFLCRSRISGDQGVSANVCFDEVDNGLSVGFHMGMEIPMVFRLWVMQVQVQCVNLITVAILYTYPQYHRY